MSMDINALLNGQRDVHGRISRSVENLRKLGAERITRSAVETRIRILDQLWTKFESQHELLRAAYKDSFFESEYVKSDSFDLAENAYVQQRSALAEYANSLSTPKIVLAKEQSNEAAPKTSLPRIKLPQFSGAYEEWPSFRDLFLSVVGENSAISNVERLHYLRSCLQGPAERLIRPLTVTGENYDHAWSLLSKHYENKRELIEPTSPRLPP